MTQRQFREKYIGRLAIAWVIGFARERRAVGPDTKMNNIGGRMKDVCTHPKFENVASRWTPDYHKKASRIRDTSDEALGQMLHTAMENAIHCEVTDQPERQLYWFRCAMLAQDEITRRAAEELELMRTNPEMFGASVYKDKDSK
jgi:hypothetical protein